MKNVILFMLISAVSLSALAGYGSGRHHQLPSADRVVNRLTDRLDLRDDQVAQIRTIVETKHAAIKESHQQTKALREEMRDEITAVLDSEQQQKFEALKNKRRHHSKQHNWNKE